MTIARLHPTTHSISHDDKWNQRGFQFYLMKPWNNKFWITKTQDIQEVYSCTPQWNNTLDSINPLEHSYSNILFCGWRCRRRRRKWYARDNFEIYGNGIIAVRRKTSNWQSMENLDDWHECALIYTWTPSFFSLHQTPSLWYSMSVRNRCCATQKFNSEWFSLTLLHEKLRRQTNAVVLPSSDIQLACSASNWFKYKAQSYW